MLEHRLWTLIEKKLSGEASGKDLFEIDELLKENPGLVFRLDNILSEWKNRELSGEDLSNSAFGKLAMKIQQMKKPGTGTVHGVFKKRNLLVF
jgi:hypothetical protein